MTQPIKKPKYLLWGMTAVIVLSGLGYVLFGSKTKTEDIEPEYEPSGDVSKAAPKTSNHQPLPIPSGSATGFPLRKGSRGNNVRLLQQILIQKYGRSILPKYGADGVWGTEVEDALISKGLPTELSQSDFQMITKGQSPKPSSTSNSASSNSTTLDPLKTSNSLHDAIGKHDFTKVLRLLGYIHNVGQYKKVNEYFKSQRPSFGSGVRMTLVNALLYKFKTSWGKKQLNNHFHRMGLLFDGEKWSLDGVSLHNQIKTIRSTRVWNKVGEAMIVPVHTVLGRFEAAKNGITQFTTLDGKTLFVNTPMISYV